ncbi:MAG: AmmeMemoRadiSam system protein A [Candidatus Firestonebacteria bacterium]
MVFTAEEKKVLLKLARDTIQFKLENRKNVCFREKGKNFVRRSGAFVTLHTKDGNLRGCIGNMVSDKPLYKTIIAMAEEAAFNDPRFAPVTLPELKEIKIEISVLSPLRKIKNAVEIELGVHGVLVKKGPFSGVFLPQVAVETGWSLEEFMNNLCSGKAGLSEDAWKDNKTDIFIFTVEMISE